MRLSWHDAVDRYDHASLRYVIYAGSPMYRADQQHALRKLGKVLVQYFGLGEVTGNITVLPPHLHSVDDDMPVGSCGYPRTGMETVPFSMIAPTLPVSCSRPAKSAREGLGVSFITTTTRKPPSRPRASAGFTPATLATSMTAASSTSPAARRIRGHSGGIQCVSTRDSSDAPLTYPAVVEASRLK